MTDTERESFSIHVGTAPYPQTVECPGCGDEQELLIDSEEIGGCGCRNLDCRADIHFRHDRRRGASEDETEQTTLMTDGGLDRLRAAVTTGHASGCFGHDPEINEAVIVSDGSVCCPACADYRRSLQPDTDREEA